jgi:hypothetical protein
MKTAMFLFAGVMISTTALATQGDPMAEERYRMKYGRYTPAEEARQKAAKERSADATAYVGQSCCRHMKHETTVERVTLNSASTEAYFKMKYGRSIPGAEAREKAAEEQVAMHIRKCAELDRCPLVAVENATSSRNVAASNSDAWFRAKYGRSVPSVERKVATLAKDERLLVAAANPVPCEMECCKHAE